jgi:hypothetical protein
MFDVARALALGWALFRSLQVRRPGGRLATLLVIAAAYPLILAVAGGVAASAGASGPLDAAYAALFFVLGPSFLPRGPLPAAVPLARVVLEWPAVVDLGIAVAMGVVSRRLADHAADLPLGRQDEALRWSRLSLALVLIFVFQLLATMLRVAPALLTR